MRINAVSSFNYNAQSNGQKQNFGGILSGVGKVRNPGGPADYVSVGFAKFIDGMSIPKDVTPKGRTLMELPDCGMTKKEGKRAVDFLTKSEKTKEGYEAALKLKAYMQRLIIPGSKKHHNAVFIEHTDGALDLQKSTRVRMGNLNQKLSAYEQSKGLKPEGVIKTVTAATEKPWLKKGPDGKPQKPSDLGQLTKWVEAGYMPDSDTLLGLLQSHGVA